MIDPYKPGLSPEESYELRRQGLTADVMIASSNAITLDGKLVNLDATGNRIAAMSFGPKKVILVVGMNKVAPDLESAMAKKRLFSPGQYYPSGFGESLQREGAVFRLQDSFTYLQYVEYY